MECLFHCQAANIVINYLYLQDYWNDMKRLYTYIYIVAGVIAAAMLLFSCTPEWQDEMEVDFSGPSVNPGDRVVNVESRNVMLLYSAGFNSLTSYLQEDIEDLKTGWLPGRNRNDDVVLVYSHFPESQGRYSTPCPPVLTRLYTDDSGTAVADTLVVYDDSAISSTPAQLNAVLSYVKENFPAAGYGMIFSSHATGYLPAGFYQRPDSYIYKEKGQMQKRFGIHGAVASPYVELPVDPDMPAVKSIGQDQVGNSGSYVSYEMDIADFADAIPMKMDYILFDACLMGGIEVAYELREKVRTIGVSQAEVLAEGLNYARLTSHLLLEAEPDPVGVCEDYFEQYDIQEGVYRSATISTIDCTALDPLAEVCAELFESYRESISSLSPGKVQRYYRSGYHWFYDLESILMEAGITSEELGRLRAALGACVLYKGHTPNFMNSFEINVFSGFSMYLPAHGNAELSKYYKTLEWNKATGLVK